MNFLTIHCNVLTRDFCSFSYSYACRSKGASEKATTPSPKKSNAQAVSAKANHTKKPQEKKPVTKTGEVKRTPKITATTQKKRTHEETKDIKIAKEEVTHKKQVTNKKNESQQMYAIIFMYV